MPPIKVNVLKSLILIRLETSIGYYTAFSYVFELQGHTQKILVLLFLSVPFIKEGLL